MQAPQFSLPDQDGVIHNLNDYRGQWVVLYFYPKDDTPGCTAEACSFRDARQAIAELGNAVVLGVSKDSIQSHKAFAGKYNLGFTLLSDPDHTVIEAYGAWRPKKFMGREFMGVHRNTVIISPSGRIVKTYEGVNPKDHAAEIITELKQLQGTR